MLSTSTLSAVLSENPGELLRMQKAGSLWNILKYLLKGQYSVASGSMYWINASRFFTNSKSLLSDENKPQLFVHKGLYEFAGVCNSEIWLDNGDFLICIEYSSPPGATTAGTK
jgi:hypothetical protein